MDTSTKQASALFFSHNWVICTEIHQFRPYCSCKQYKILGTTNLSRLVGPNKIDHLQSWSEIFPSDRTKMVRSICPFRLISSRTFRNFGLNGKHPGLNCNRPTDIFQSKLDLRKKPTNSIFLTVTNLILSCNSPLFESRELEPICAQHSLLGSLLGTRRSAIGHFIAVPITVPEVFAKLYSV